MSGIGAAAAERLKSAGIETLGQLAEAGEGRLERMFGKNGKVMFLRACGRDDAPVNTESKIKSVSAETTFAQALTDVDNINAAISTLSTKVGRRLRAKGLAGSTVSLKVRFQDRTTHSVQQKLVNPTDDELLFAPLLHKLLSKLWNPGTPILLIGVAISGFSAAEGEQEALFDAAKVQPLETDPKPLIDNKQKRKSLLTATDAIKDKFGDDALKYGHQLKNADNTTGTTPKNPTDYK